jgi:hypothetical protein
MWALTILSEILPVVDNIWVIFRQGQRINASNLDAAVIYFPGKKRV